MVTGCTLALPLTLAALLAALAAVCRGHVDMDMGDLAMPGTAVLRRRHADPFPLIGGGPEAADAALLAASLPTSTPASAAASRAERSANLSHIAGAGRKIMMYVRNRHLQILPDGTVNGTDHEGSDYAVLQRTSVNKVQVKMQGVATCLFLCMDACGLLYGSKELTDDCLFNEMLEQHYYNTYSSAKYSTAYRSLYLALDRRGASRRVQIRRGARGELPQGRLAAYTRVLTKPVTAERVFDLMARLRGPGLGGHFRHRGHHAVCPPHGHPEATPRRPRRCPRPGGQGQGLQGHARGGQPRKHAGARRPPASPAPAPTPTPAPAPAPAPAATEVPAGPPAPRPAPPRRKCEATEDEDLCHKRLAMIAAKKRKSRNEKKHGLNVKRIKIAKKVPTVAPAPVRVPVTTPSYPPPLHPGLVQRTEQRQSQQSSMNLEAEASEEDDHDDEEEHEDSVTDLVSTTASPSDEDAATAASLALADDP